MITIFFQQTKKFFFPHLYQFCIRQGSRVYHQPRPGAFKTNTDTILISCSHPEFIPRSSMGTSDIYVTSLHQLHESISQVQVIRGKSKRNMITTTQPITISVQKKQTFFHFKSAETGSLRQAIQFVTFCSNQTETKIIQIRMLRSPKTGFQPIYVISEHLFFVSIQHQFLQRKLTIKYRTSFFIYNISIEIKLILFSTMIFHCQIKRSSVQTRFNKYIFHFQRAGNRQFHRLPNTSRLVTIKTMGYIFQKITLR